MYMINGLVDEAVPNNSSLELVPIIYAMGQRGCGPDRRESRSHFTTEHRHVTRTRECHPCFHNLSSASTSTSPMKRHIVYFVPQSVAIMHSTVQTAVLNAVEKNQTLVPLFVDWPTQPYLSYKHILQKRCSKLRSRNSGRQKERHLIVLDSSRVVGQGTAKSDAVKYCWRARDGLAHLVPRRVMAREGVQGLWLHARVCERFDTNAARSAESTQNRGRRGGAFAAATFVSRGV
jgi:hypothetical protein